MVGREEQAAGGIAHLCASAAEEDEEVDCVARFARRGTPAKVFFFFFFGKIDWRMWESNLGLLVRHGSRAEAAPGAGQTHDGAERE